MPVSSEVSGRSAPRAAEVYGHFDIPCGLQISALNTVKQFESRGWITRLHSVVLAEERVTPAVPEYEATVNLFHVNPKEFSRMFAWKHENPRFESRLNVAMPYWELPTLPHSWPRVLRGMDLILAPTTFIAEAVRASVPDVPIELHPQAVDIPKGVTPDRARFGIDAQAFVFGTSFAADAVLERKNPWGVIRAFQEAFPDDADVRLVVRASPGSWRHAETVWEELREAAGGDGRIIIPTGRLEYVDVLCLYASFDAYVSLHRSEGLGLGMMEAMAIGVPVIATGWSGNMDFMDESNALLVGYDTVPVEVGPLSPYSEEHIGHEGQWVEPRVSEAAEHMRRLRQDAGLREQVAQKAQADIGERVAMVQRADFVDVVEQHAAAVRRSGSGHARRAATLRAIERRESVKRPYYVFRHQVGRLLRALRLR